MCISKAGEPRRNAKERGSEKGHRPRSNLILGQLVGKRVICGTRLAVEFILGLIAPAWPEAETMRNYWRTSEQIRAGAAYARAVSRKVSTVAPPYRQT